MTGRDIDNLVDLSRVLVGLAVRSLDVGRSPVPLPQFRALAVVHRIGPCTAGGLSACLDQPPSTVTRLVDKLVAGGLVQRTTRANNRREVEIDLTTEGHRVVERVFRARGVQLEQILARMPRASRDALGRALPDLLHAAEDHQPGSQAPWAV
jgi:DNA-binding MarR family transcriptional regulator